MESLLSSYDTLKDFRQISPEVQTALKQVYAIGCILSITEAIGMYLHILWNIGGFLTTFATLGCIFWLHATLLWELRLSLIIATSLLQGASLVPIIKLFIDFDPRFCSIWVSEFIGNAIVFACFSVAVMLARRREFLYLGALLSSGVSIFFWSHFASKLFGGAIAFFQFDFCFGLMVAVGFMVVATQVLISKTWIQEFSWKGSEEEEKEEEEGDYGQELHSTTNKNSV